MDRPTPSQTVGPFFHIGMEHDHTSNRISTPATPGMPIVLEGRVLDGEGTPVPDALIEVWQADAAGVYRHPLHESSGQQADRTMTGFGRCSTDAGGVYQIETVMPGAVVDLDGQKHAPHLNLIVFARGLLDNLLTRIYFAADHADPVLSIIPELRRSTLLAVPIDHEGANSRYRFDVRLQGADETVFLEV